MASAVEFGAIANAAKCLESADINCREAAARVLLDIARCVDFEKHPKAVDDFRNPATIARIAKTREMIAAMTDEGDAIAVPRAHRVSLTLRTMHPDGHLLTTPAS